MIRRLIIASMALGGAIALTGCTSGAGIAPPGPQASEEPTADHITCTSFGDVLTITANADAGLRDGRMESQEVQGWYRLATRVLDRMPTSGAGPVSDAIGELKDTAPVVSASAMNAAGMGSTEWVVGVDTLSAACTDAGFELAVNMFTGG